MSQLKQPGFLKKIEKVISAIPGLENQLFTYRKKNRSANSLVFIDRKDEERILMNLLQRQQKDKKQAEKIEYIFQGDKLSPYSVLSFIYWRYTKLIYRLSNDIVRDVAGTYVDNIPDQVLKEFPAWSIYVAAEELHTELPTPYPIHGFFFYPLVNHDGNIIRLFIVDDLKQGQGISGLKEKDVDVVDNIVRIKDSREGLIESRTMECIDGEVVVTINEEIKDFRDREFNLLNAQLSMVLYICSQKNDIREADKSKRPGKNKGQPYPSHESPAADIREWDVGIRMGQAIRQYRQSETAGEDKLTTTASKRPHIRRGHWHTYWTGSRKPELAYERKPKLKWLPPVPINSEDVDSLPVVITPVEK
jgi:hypothetical protein